MNNVVLVGRLTKDPELKHLGESRNAVANFTLAIDRKMSKAKKQEAESKKRPTADFIRIIVWGKTAELCANYLTKGLLVGIQGKIQTGSYDVDGTKKYTTDVVANEVDFLEWGDKNKNQEENTSNTGGLEGFHPTDDDDLPF